MRGTSNGRKWKDITVNLGPTCNLKQTGKCLINNGGTIRSQDKWPAYLLSLKPCTVWNTRVKIQLCCQPVNQPATPHQWNYWILISTGTGNHIRERNRRWRCFEIHLIYGFDKVMFKLYPPVNQDSYAGFDKGPNNGDGWYFQVEKLIVQSPGVMSITVRNQNGPRSNTD